MELRRLSLCLALFVLAVYTQCSDAHAMRKRGTDDNDFDDIMGDEASDAEAQNDADGGDGEEEDSIPAVIRTLPTTYNVTAGSSIRLECRVEPADDAVIQWFRNGEPFFMGKMAMGSLQYERFSIADGSNDLLVSDVMPSDSGIYKCKVLQVPPTAIEHTLVVHEAPRIIEFTASNNGTVIEGSVLVLTCDVAGSPPPQIMWSRENDAGNVRLQEKDGNFTLNSVSISNVGREHSGRYYCYALNGFGNAQAELYVKVLHKPYVHVHKTVVNSAVQVEAVLQCTAHAEPAPAITWFKDGIILDSSSSLYIIRTEGSNSNLTVVPQADEDFGTFTCEARNSHGAHNKSIELVQRPVIEELDADGNKLSWRVHSHLPLDVIELQLTSMDEGKLITVNVPIPKTTTGHEYEVVYVLENMEPGKYEAIVKAKNSKEWSGITEPIVVEYEAQPMYIQHASMYPGSSHSIRPTTTLMLSTMIIYLLVRMF